MASLTVYPGEWVCRLSELTEWFRVRFQRQALSILKNLQNRHLITFTQLGHGKLVKYSIKGWRRHNTVLDYNCPCQKESGFFFLPVSVATELISSGRASEMDVVLDLWLCAIYKDNQVMGSEIGPVVYLRNGTGNPLLNYSDLAQRWGISRSTVGRLLEKLSGLGYLTLMSFPGRTGSVIYLNNYLSTMFQVSDVMVDKDEVAMSLHIKFQMPDTEGEPERCPNDPQVCVSESLGSVSKPQVDKIVEKVSQILAPQGIPCFRCSRSTVKLYPLSDCGKGTVVGTGNGEFRTEENGRLSSNGLYTTDDNGQIKISGVVGTLAVKETKTIPGYTIDPATQTQTVTVNPAEMAKWSYEHGYWCSKSGSYHALIPNAAKAWDLSILLNEASKRAGAGGPFWIIG